MLLAVDLNFMVFFVYLDDMMGQLFALFFLTVETNRIDDPTYNI